MGRRPPKIVVNFPITKQQFFKIEKAVRKAGYSDAIQRSENVTPPKNAKAFAAEAIYVICNSGMSNVVALQIFERCMAALREGRSARTVFGHPGKAVAIDKIWSDRVVLFKEFRKTDDLLGFCGSLPWTGEVTKYHLAKNLGADVAKPDVHINRLCGCDVPGRRWRIALTLKHVRGVRQCAQ
jgi:hypothetical protein